MNKLKKLIKRPIFWVGVVVLAIILVVIFSGSGDSGKYDYTEAKRGAVVQEVSVTGDVRPIEGVDLAFEKSGRVSRVDVGVGNEVYRGQPLVLLGASDLYAQLDEAEANLKAEESKLVELKRGPTSQEINVERSEVDETEQDLLNKYGSVITTVEDAYAQADDAVRTKTAEFFKESGDSYILEYDACNSSDENQANFARLRSENMLNDWRLEIEMLDVNSSKAELLEALDKAQENLSLVTNFLNEVGDTLTVGCELSDSTVSTYRGKVSTARDNVNTALSAIDSLEQSIALKEKTLVKKERELEELLAGASEEEIDQQEAAVEKARSQVNNIKAQIEKGILRAPFSGEVTKVDAERGEIVDAYDPVVSVISESGFKIEVNIPEVDVSKVEVGDKARVTLDAYGDNVEFGAEIITIDSTETVIEGVSTYGATLEFEGSDERIKSGMTANVDIMTGMVEDVIYVPRRAVIEEDGRVYVRALEDEEVIEKEVETGLEGSKGNVEIRSGIEEGEKVIIFIEE